MIKKKGFQKMKKKIWPAMICPVLFIILMRILIPFIYGMVDDRSMMEIVSGQYTGMPDPHMIFTGYWYGLLVAGFYWAAPAGGLVCSVHACTGSGMPWTDALSADGKETEEKLVDCAIFSADMCLYGNPAGNTGDVYDYRSSSGCGTDLLVYDHGRNPYV